MKVTVKNYKVAATWTWAVDADYCTICQLSFDACCPDCKLPGDDCNPAVGACSHTFHLHCILRWLNGSETCPVCRATFKFKESEAS